LRDSVFAAGRVPLACLAKRFPAGWHGALLLRPVERPRGAGRTERAGEQALKNQVAQERVRQGRAEKVTLGIVDAQSVKNTDTAQEKGYDAGKKVSGIKRHVTVDILGLPLAIHITTADVGARQGRLDLLGRHQDTLSEVIKLLVDGGYTGENFAQGVADKLQATVEAVKRPELHKFAVHAQALDRGALVRVASEMPPAVEKL